MGQDTQAYTSPLAVHHLTRSTHFVTLNRFGHGMFISQVQKTAPAEDALTQEESGILISQVQKVDTVLADS